MWIGVDMICWAKYLPNFNKIHQTLQLLSRGHHQCYNCYPAVIISVTTAIQRSSSVLQLLSSDHHQCYNCYPAVIISATFPSKVTLGGDVNVWGNWYWPLNSSWNIWGILFKFGKCFAQPSNPFVCLIQTDMRLQTWSARWLYFWGIPGLSWSAKN